MNSSTDPILIFLSSEHNTGLWHFISSFPSTMRNESTLFLVYEHVFLQCRTDSQSAVCACGVLRNISILGTLNFWTRNLWFWYSLKFRITSLSNQVVRNLNYVPYFINIAGWDKQLGREKKLAVTTHAILPPTTIIKTYQETHIPKMNTQNCSQPITKTLINLSSSSLISNPYFSSKLYLFLKK